MRFETNVPLAPLTTLRIGGPASFFVRARSRKDVMYVAEEARARQLPLVVLGEGSNVLVSDEGVAGIVLKNELRGVSFEPDGMDVLVCAAAGEQWDTLVAETVRRNLFGIENLSGIPGTVGATPVQNIGAYGREVSEVIEWVDVYDAEHGVYMRLPPRECRFAYRDSVFKKSEGRRFVIVSVCYRLSCKGKLNLAYKDVAEYFDARNVEPTLGSVREAVLSIRAKKFPDLSKIGTAGSFFKIPIVPQARAGWLSKRFPDMPIYPVDSTRAKVSISWLLDHVLDLKGERKGSVGTYEQHVLAFVNYGGATAADIRSFAEYVADRVRNEIGIEIEPEVTYIGKNKK